MIKNYFYIIYISLFFITSHNCYSQSNTLRFEHLTTESGLPRNQVHSLLQDHIGYIWAGTGDGLSKYDGYRFKTFNKETSNLAGKHVVSIYEDKSLDLWVATNKGFSKFNRASRNFENFVVDSLLVSEKKDFYATKILEDNDKKFWVGTQKGLFLFNRKTKKIRNDWSNHALKRNIDESRITSIFQDSKSRLWVGTYEKGLFLIIFNDEKEVDNIKFFKHNQNDNTTINSDRINDIKEDKEGDMWFATRGGLCKLKPGNYIFQKIQNPYKKEVVYFDMISSVTIDSQGDLFVGHLNGMYHLPKNTTVLKSINIITNNPQLKHNYGMNSQFIDKSGVLWLTSSNGIYKHDMFLLKFKAYRANQDNPESSRQNQIWSILKDKDNQVWIGTSYGLNKLEWSEQTKKHEYVHMPNNADKVSDQNKYSITSMIEFNDDNLIISKRNGLFIFNKQGEFFTKIPFPKNIRPNKMCWGEKNILWIGTNKGILKYDILKKEYIKYILPTGKDYPSNNWTHSIHVDKENRVWVGTLSGINFFIPSEEKFHFIKRESTSEYKSVWNIYSDNDGSIWYGIWGDGLNHIEPIGEKRNFIDGYKIEEFHVKDGLSNEYVYSVLPGENDNLWMSTNMGLSRLNKKTKIFENYTAEEGLQSNEFNSGAYFRAADGELFFGGPSGINAFYPATIFKNKTTPNVVVTAVVVNGKEIEIPKEQAKNDYIILKHNQNPLRLEFSALSYNKPSKNKYQIKLDNYDKSWVSMDHNTSITYSKLPPGKYSFKVKGASHDGYWSDTTTTLNFEITPPYWKTWWFYTSMAFIGLCFTYLIFIIKLRQVKLKEKNLFFEKQNEEKKAVIKEIHHRIKNNLQMVISLLRLQSSKVADEEVVDMFKETQKRILSMALLHEKMQQDDDLKGIDVQEHFSILINNLIKSYEIEKDITLNININKIDLGMETLTPLGLIVNEVITNSLKYAFVNKNKGVIIVSLKKVRTKVYELIIGDDGVGFIPKKESLGLGTKLIQIFTKQLNGKIEMLNEPGTVYKLVFKKAD